MDKTLLVALEERDVGAACRFIEDEVDPARVLAMYHGAIRHLYWSEKDLGTLVQVGRRALSYAADEAHLGFVKSIAYDVGSFCWPGWNEPGIAPGPDALALGAEAAALNLALAERLHRPALVFANAHWLVGAYELAAERSDEALRSFERAHAFAADDRPTELLMSGYVAMARGEQPSTDELAALEDGDELIAQLEGATKRFATRP